MGWRRWVGGIVGGAVAFAAGVAGGGKLHAWMQQVELASDELPRRTIVVGLGGVAALIGALVGYQRGRRADAQRSRRR